jgi:oligoendopeptidase F
MIYDVDGEEETTWAQIPHIFHTPFYCYAYAFGSILTFALYENIQMGEISVEDYKNILRSGGSERPRELLLRYGIDIESREFYQSALRTIEKMVEEFESS